MKKELENQYFEEDYKRDIMPYKMYLSSLEKVFNFQITDSFIDLGCQNGRLIEAIKRKYNHINVAGVDYFDWAKKYADSSVKENIRIADLSKKNNFDLQYDIVNCSEVGEHIEKESEDIFLDNLIGATKNTLILTWSNKPSYGHDQHQNPRPKGYIINKMKERGMVYWEEAADLLSDNLQYNLLGVGFGWWSEDVMVFKKVKCFTPKSCYLIQNVSSDDANHRVFYLKKGLYHKSLQEAFMDLTELINNIVAQKNGSTILRASDGDYFFLRKIEIGSAKPGNRALIKPYDEINLPFYKALFWKNDFISMSIEKSMYNSWKKYIFYEMFDRVFWKINFKYKGKNTFKYINYIFDNIFSIIIGRNLFSRAMAWLVSIHHGKIYRKKALNIVNKTYIPLDCVYALVATKWIFKKYKNEIGIIANEEKAGLIKLLMEREEYRNYIGVDYFTDYIKVPQKGAADNLSGLSEEVGKQIKNSKAKIFLVGAGSSKIGLMPLLKTYSEALFIDVGCGIDALAGVVCQERPYFSEWINYRINGFDYSKVDFMDQGNPAWKKPEYQIKWIS